MQIPVTANIFLRPIERKDRATALATLADPAIASATTGIPWPYTADDFAAMMAKAEAAELEHGRPTYLAIRDSSGLLIGAINFREIISDGVFEIGYYLGKPWWNRGIMTVSVRAACQHAFDEWDALVIFASPFLSNPASKRELEKCGFTNGGQHQLDKDNSPVDAWMFVLQRDSLDEAPF